ncbi:armadillo-type protein [Syncephalastrum racemosum]|uniref:Armadillo-type protein n=1 Tax=Syncephalastrum racemosum TaxID=13706 RepID=A0A1X2HI10_SYNRA|nr:armadillo-type protein [Syncephalastrum racemosum]
MAEEFQKRKAIDDHKENSKKLKTSAESHRDQRVLRQERKSQGRHAAMISQAKKIWEDLRRGDLDREETRKQMANIMSVITGHVQEIIFKHDASRIIQTCLKKGNAEQRLTIAKELNGRYEELSKSMYGKFIVQKALEYCHGHRSQILSEFRTHIRKLIRHREASAVIEAFYAQFSTGAQRQELLAEFYGPEMTLFNRGGGATSLEGLLETMPEKKDAVLKFMGETLVGCMDKGTIIHSIVHKALLQYMTLTDDKGRENLMVHLRDNLQEILHTRDGAKVAMICLCIGTPKDRKAIIKSFKPFLPKIAEDEHGYVVLLTMMDVVDDTKMVHVAMLNELIKKGKKLVSNKYARRVFLYLLSGRNTKYLSYDTVQQLKVNDEWRRSKKDPETRSRELLEYASPELIELVAENAPVLLREKMASQVVQEIMLHAVGDKSKAIDAILVLVDESIEKENHIMEDRFGNRVIKAMVKGDTAEDFNDKARDPLGFAPLLLEHIRERIGHFAINYGSFVVVSLAEVPSTAEKTKALLGPHKDKIRMAAAEHNAGAKILQETL